MYIVELSLVACFFKAIPSLAAAFVVVVLCCLLRGLTTGRCSGTVVGLVSLLRTIYIVKFLSFCARGIDGLVWLVCPPLNQPLAGFLSTPNISTTVAVVLNTCRISEQIVLSNPAAYDDSEGAMLAHTANTESWPFLILWSLHLVAKLTVLRREL